MILEEIRPSRISNLKRWLQRDKKAPSLGEGAVTRRVTEGGVADRRSRTGENITTFFLLLSGGLFDAGRGLRVGLMIND